MADYQNYSITPRSAVNVNLPRLEIEVQITDSNTGAIQFDFTGVNSIMFPQYMTNLTPDERRAFAQYIASWLIRHKAGML